MGWINQTNNKPQLYFYHKPYKGYPELNSAYNEDISTAPEKCTTPPYFTWAAQHFWEGNEDNLYKDNNLYGYEYCVKYENDTQNPIAFSSVAIKACACDSGKNSYWSFTGEVGACIGYGASYYAYVRVSNDNEKSFKKSNIITSSYVNLPNTNGSNMNSPGSSSSNTAVFGRYPYEGTKGLVPREFTISDCPLIEPRGVGYIHFGITNFESPGSNGQYQFILDPKEMTVNIDEGVDPYIWVYNKDKDHPGWHLFRPLYVFDGNWKSGDGE